MDLKTGYLDKVISAAQSVDLGEVEKLIASLESAYTDGRSVFLIGNGGSAANATHFAQDLSKGAIPDMEGKRFRVLSLAENMCFVTAISNDIGYERVFELQLKQFAAKGDLLIAISGSGNSANIIKAVEYARDIGMRVAGFTGFDGGKLMGLSDVRVHVPLDQMCMAEAVHSIFMHMVTDLLKERLSGKIK
ncbi:SIS domain-containing protein [Verrucomicrobiota bacterium]